MKPNQFFKEEPYLAAGTAIVLFGIFALIIADLFSDQHNIQTETIYPNPESMCVVASNKDSVAVDCIKL